MTSGAAYATEPVDALAGRALPDLSLQATDGTSVNLLRLEGISVVYAYPRTSPPNGPAIAGWSDIPGAKGCTPQSCAFRDHFEVLKSAGAAHVFGLSTQSSDYQAEAVERLHLPFPLLSDESLALQQALGLPLLKAEGMTLLHRVTLIIRDGVIAQVFHTIDDPANNAKTVLDALSNGI